MCIRDSFDTLNCKAMIDAALTMMKKHGVELPVMISLTVSDLAGRTLSGQTVGREKEPLAAFCKKCRELGVPVYEMDLIAAGEEFYAAMKRSTNGGGENSPMLEGEDDFYELFFAGLE